MTNIVYSGAELADYYASNRNTWNAIYASEKEAFHFAAGQNGSLGSVLDVGCGAGGLCLALGEQKMLTSYTGVDIHAGAIAYAQSVTRYSVPAEFFANDILKITSLPQKQYDTVVSLSRADWNLETNSIIERCWEHVVPGGNFIITLRLTDRETIRNFEKSYQYIFFGDTLPDDRSGLETAPYVVLNVRDALNELTSLAPSPEALFGYGYWGTPSATAVTPYDRLMFAALVLRKPKGSAKIPAQAILHFPIDILL